MARSLPLVSSLVFALSASLAIGCGPKVPAHNGYKKNRTKPWRKAKPVELDAENEAEIDGKVSWKKRRRARWYAIDLANNGDLAVTIRAEQIGSSEEEFDLAFEIINEAGKVLVSADQEEDDAGEEERTRKIAELDPGIYWLHIYLQQRAEAATFNARIKFEPGPPPDLSTFPDEVRFVGNLPAVPPVDDAPPPRIVRKKCKGKKCKKVVKPPPQTTSSIKARLIGVSARDNGRTAITIGVGTNRGITKGSRGSVVNSSGKRIQGGGFTVTKVTSTKAYASVKASIDAVKSAKYARVTPKI